MAGGRLTADPLFQGLARPAMVAGVSYMFFVLNAMVCMVMYIQTKSFTVLPLALVMHGFGYLLCMKEPRAVELWMLRMKYGYKSFNRAYHSFTNSYDVF
jgi:type IV secretion system protein VirB3